MYIEIGVLIISSREALRKWKNKKGPDATYGALLEIFVAAEENDCAEVLCSILREGGIS